MVTIEEVAAHCGLSVATVSRVLNGHNSVRPVTAQRVQEAIRALNYTPNQSARNLRRNESRIILALAPNFSNPYYSRILTGIGDQSQSLGYSVLICSTASSAENEQRFLRLLEGHRADGAIFLGCRKNFEWLGEYAARFPLVQCCEYVPGLEAASVSIDNMTASRETVQYLIGLGHERIAMIGAANELISSELRREGWRTALSEAGLSVPETYYAEADADYSFASGRLAAEKLLSNAERPTAIFCVSDILALSVIAAAGERGLRVPEDLTVTGFDDVDYTTMFHPYLTTVSQPCYEMGRRSLTLLLDMIEGRAAKLGRLFMEHRLIVRESAASPGLPCSGSDGRYFNK